MSSPWGQKQPKLQKLEQLCCGLEQVLTQTSPHSWYTWLAGHWPTAVGSRHSLVRRFLPTFHSSHFIFA